MTRKRHTLSLRGACPLGASDEAISGFSTAPKYPIFLKDFNCMVMVRVYNSLIKLENTGLKNTKRNGGTDG
jgi:hypothetical protein